MKCFICVIGLIVTFVLQGNAQEKFTVEVDATGNDRLISNVLNTNNSALSTARFTVQAGTNSLSSAAELATFHGAYTASAGYAGYSALTNRGSGIILRAFNGFGNIRFLTGGGDIAGNTRMLINNVGQVGFGTADPKKKIHLKEGDLYMDTASGGEIIMKSPNGTCYSITVSNAGALGAALTPGGCPN